MEKEKFRLWAQSLGLKTGAELEKRIEFSQNESVEREVEVKTETAPVFDAQSSDDFYILPTNYFNKYNLTRGDFFQAIGDMLWHKILSRKFYRTKSICKCLIRSWMKSLRNIIKSKTLKNLQTF